MRERERWRPRRRVHVSTSTRREHASATATAAPPECTTAATVLDLCCCSGGWSVGFQQEGFRILAGVDSDYEAPQHAELTLSTVECAPEVLANEVVDYLQNHLFIN